MTPCRATTRTTPVSADRPADPVSANLDGQRTSLRVGLLGGWFKENASPEAICVTELVASRLHARKAELPGARAARAAAFCLTGAEGGSLHLADLRTRPGDFDPATRDRLIAGAMQPAHVLAKAQRVRRWFLEQALELFEEFDILLAPATPFPATPDRPGHDPARRRAGVGARQPRHVRPTDRLHRPAGADRAGDQEGRLAHGRADDRRALARGPVDPRRRLAGSRRGDRGQEAQRPAYRLRLPGVVRP
ncbi:MAG: hypothetical protein WDN45_18145 [Caulobacteraceae bacterium]